MNWKESFKTQLKALEEINVEDKHLNAAVSTFIELAKNIKGTIYFQESVKMGTLPQRYPQHTIHLA
jgi:hypothetical protein